MKKPSIKNILVPVDFSQISIQAIAGAKRLAQRFGATVHLVHVHEFYPTEYWAMSAPVPIGIVPLQEDSAAEIARRLDELAARHGLSSRDCHSLEGSPTFNEICKLAREIPADLIFTATHGYTGLEHVVQGSTAERIVQHSPCPVFVTKASSVSRKNAKARTTLSIDKILVPVDFSGCSLAGLNYALQFAERITAKLVLLHAVYVPDAIEGNGRTFYDPTRFIEAARQNAEWQMREFLRSARFGSVKFETAIRIGPPVQEICAFAQGHDIDLIITPSHGRTGFNHLLIGSIAEHVVRHAHCPVLVVPSHPEVRTAKLRLGTRPAQRPKVRRVTKRPTNASETSTKGNGRPAHPFPERRKTNKFRESHAGRTH